MTQQKREALNHAAVERMKPAAKVYRRPDGRGLWIEVRPTGAKLWRYRYEVAQPDGSRVERMATLGAFPAVGLAEARELRAAAREAVRAGRDVVQGQRENRAAAAAQDAQAQAEAARSREVEANTVEALARDWQAAHAAQWSPAYAKQVGRYFTRDVLPAIGAKPVDSVGVDDLRPVIKSLIQRAAPVMVGSRERRGGRTAARQVRQWLSAMFAWAVAEGRADRDPARDLLGMTKRRQGEQVRSAVALTPGQLGELLRAVDGYGGERSTVIALRLLALLMVRTVELRCAKWAEFTLDGADPVWRIPADRMKKRAAHTVPLPPQAVALLIELRALTGGNEAGWILPNRRRPSEPMTATTINRALERMGYGGKFAAHGFRATASTILHEADSTPDVIEAALAHRTPGVRGIYSRAAYLSQRRALLMRWGDYLDRITRGADVIEFPRRVAV